MATGASEAKAETKPESKPEANKEKEVEEKQEQKQEQLKYKTSVLKVSIHCEGCKRKVKKILTNIDGVYTTNIDLRQQKVIVAGDVPAETLIRKLEKNGKHAELWPESKAEQKEKKQGKAKNKEKQQQQQQKQGDQESSDEGNNHPAEKETVKEPSKSKENGNGGGGAGTSKNVENNGAVHHVVKVNEAGGQVAKESKPDQVKQTVTFAAGSQSPVGGGGESEGGVEKSGGGGGGGSSGGKKKKNKGQKGNNGNSNVVIGEGEPSGVGSDAPAGTGSPIYGPHGPTHTPFPSPANYSPPRQHGYPYPQYPPPPHYYTPPAYAVSYNTAHARPSYSASYYAAPTPHSYAYMHPGTGSEIPPSDVDSYSSQPADSFEIFSDENPNACSIM